MPFNRKQNSSNSNFCDRPLFSWALHGNSGLQILLVLAVILLVFSRVIPLELQKRIVNESIALREYNNLFLYCAIYLSAVISANILKFGINSLQTLIGERVMSRMRQSLYNHIILLPLSFFRRTQPGFVVSSLITELSTVGTFAGMAIAVPLTNILTLVAMAAYLMWLNLQLALATLAIYPIAIFVIPVLQRKANTANKKRVDLSREVSSKIAESISGINEINAHGSYHEENRKFALLIEQLKKIRIRWTLLRHGIKVTNNFFVGLGPFIVFLLGGYLAIEGKLELGALVAFLSAQEKLYDPWKELIAYYQLFQDAQVRHEKTTSYFNVDSEIDLSVGHDHLPDIQGNLVVSDLSFYADDHLLLKDISFSLAKGEHLALVGSSGSGKSTLAKCITNLHGYSSGSIRFDGLELRDLSKTYISNNIGFVSQQPFIFTGTVEENLVYAYTAKYKTGQAPLLSLDEKIEALQMAGIFVDVLRFGLDTTLPHTDEAFKRKIIKMRMSFFKNYAHDYLDIIEFFDADGENLPAHDPQSNLIHQAFLDDQPIINNIFYGKILSSEHAAQEKINQAVVQLLIEEDCLETVAQSGLHYNVGSEGVRLSGGQRQKLAIARVILKKPNFFIFDEATSALDNRSQTRIERLRVRKWGGRYTVIAVVHRLDIIDTYDKIAVMQNGRIVEFGSYQELMSHGTFLRKLISGKMH